MFLLVVVASSNELVQRDGTTPSYHQPDVNIGGMAAIFPCHFHDKVRMTFEKQENLELDDQGDTKNVKA